MVVQPSRKQDCWQWWLAGQALRSTPQLACRHLHGLLFGGILASPPKSGSAIIDVTPHYLIAPMDPFDTLSCFYPGHARVQLRVRGKRKSKSWHSVEKERLDAERVGQFQPRPARAAKPQHPSSRQNPKFSTHSCELHGRRSCNGIRYGWLFYAHDAAMVTVTPGESNPNAILSQTQHND